MASPLDAGTRRCGTSGTSVKPRPDIDVRQEAALNATERAMTPYTWLLSPECKDQVKQFFTALVNRRNTITGLLYRDDATIFRCRRQGGRRGRRAVRRERLCGRRCECRCVCTTPIVATLPLPPAGTSCSWNVMNEPRCKYCGPEAVDSWYGELADHLKASTPAASARCGGAPPQAHGPGGAYGSAAGALAFLPTPSHCCAAERGPQPLDYDRGGGLL